MAVVNRLITSSWEDSEASQQLQAGRAHKKAMSRFFVSDFAAEFSTVVRVPQRFNGLWVRYTACDQMVDYERDNGKCRCRSELPDQPPHW